MEQNKNESIWADGVPANVDEKYIFKYPELLTLCIKFIVEQYLIPKGYKIENVQNDPSQMPNVVVKKDGQVAALIVGAFPWPQIGMINDKDRLGVLNVVKKYNGRLFLAPVVMRPQDEARAKAKMFLKGDMIQLQLKGFIELTDIEDYTPDFAQDLVLHLDAALAKPTPDYSGRTPKNK